MKAGDKIEAIYYGSENYCYQSLQEKGLTRELVLDITYHGDYDIYWAVIIQNGKEVGAN